MFSKNKIRHHADYACNEKQPQSVWQTSFDYRLSLSSQLFIISIKAFRILSSCQKVSERSRKSRVQNLILPRLQSQSLIVVSQQSPYRSNRSYKVTCFARVMCYTRVCSAFAFINIRLEIEIKVEIESDQSKQSSLIYQLSFFWLIKFNLNLNFNLISNTEIKEVVHVM